MTLRASNLPTTRPSLTLDFAKSRRLDPRITFTRASSGTVTNSSGQIITVPANVPRFDHDPTTGESLGLLVEEARTNLRLNSATYQPTSGETPAAYTVDQVAPDGTLTGSRQTAATPRTFEDYTGIANALYTFSFYCRVTSGTATFSIQLKNAAIDTVITSDTSPVATTTWKRFSISGTTNGATPGARVELTGVVPGFVFWGAQLEAGAFPTSYIPTLPTFVSRASSATFFDSAGTLQTAASGVARSNAFLPDSAGVFRSAGLLLEEARTNLALYSQAINLANWGSQQATTQTLNAATSPDGSSNATLLAENTQNANRFIGQAIGVTNAAHTVSVFAKAKERRRIMFRESSFSGTSATFDLQSGTVVGSEGSPVTSIQPYGNGWYRCVMTYTPSSTSTRLHSVYLMPDSGTSFATSIYTGDGTSGLFLFGFQVEAGAFPTSYILTTTAAATRAADVSTSATATRAADVVSITGSAFSSWYSQSEGTFYSENRIGGFQTNSYPNVFNVSDSVNTNIIANFRLDYAIRYTYSVAAGGTNQTGFNASSIIAAGAVAKMATAVATNNGILVVNGIEQGADSSLTMPTGINVLKIPGGGDMTIRRLTFWPQRLPNSTLQALTQ